MFIVKPEILKEKKNFVLIDCRYIMTEPEKGYLLYKKSHIKGALYIDLDKDLVGKLSEHGGRHPLKDLDLIKEKMESLGISDEKDVFIYDFGDMPMASVLWFALQLIGKDSYVIEGGYDALVNLNFEVTNEVPKIEKAKINSPQRLNMRADVNDAINSINNDKIILVDVRANYRYLGIEEPFDYVAGHIPDAINIFWKDLFDKNSKLKSRKELDEIFSVVEGYEEVIFQCGSGITGAVGLLVYSSLGKKAKLYSGSFSDYISYKGNKLIVKDGKEIIL